MLSLAATCDWMDKKHGLIGQIEFGQKTLTWLVTIDNIKIQMKYFHSNNFCCCLKVFYFNYTDLARLELHFKGPQVIYGVYACMLHIYNPL